jgi:hypothetical protein
MGLAALHPLRSWALARDASNGLLRSGLGICHNVRSFHTISPQGAVWATCLHKTKSPDLAAVLRISSSRPYHASSHGCTSRNTPRARIIASLSALKSLDFAPRRRYCSSSTTHSVKMAQELATTEYRLPVNVKPRHYDVTIHTDLKELVFNGFVKIRSVINSSSSSYHHLQT